MSEYVSRILRRLGFTLVILQLLSSCGGSSGSSSSSDSSLTIPQQFQAASLTTPLINMDGELVRTLDADIPAVPGTPESSALAFLDQFRMAFGLDDVSDDVFVNEVLDDGAGHQVVVLQRMVEGVVVWNSEVRVHIQNNRITFVSAALPAVASVPSANPVITESEAIALAVQSENVLPGEDSAMLVVFAPGLLRDDVTSSHLAWVVELSAPQSPFSPTVIVDAIDGEILERFDKVAHLSNRTVAHAREQHERCPDGCYFSDVAIAAHDVWFEENGIVDTLPPPPVTDASLDLFVWLGHIHDYFSESFGRDGPDGTGGKIYAFLNHPRLPNEPQSSHNSIYIPVIVGSESGETRDALFFRDSWISADMVYHEYVHAVSRNSANLHPAFQSGALMETLSDVFAVFSAMRQDGKTDWQITRRNGEFVRELTQSDPSTVKATHISSYNPGNSGSNTHFNSSISSLAIYLMTVGGDHPSGFGAPIVALGREQVEQILYRALWLYFSPTTDFDDARWKMLRACEDFVSRGGDFGITTQSCGTVLNAFAAVGIGERDDDRDTYPNSLDDCPAFFNPFQEKECEDSGDDMTDPDDPDITISYNLGVQPRLRNQCGARIIGFADANGLDAAGRDVLEFFPLETRDDRVAWVCALEKRPTFSVCGIHVIIGDVEFGISSTVGDIIRSNCPAT